MNDRSRLVAASLNTIVFTWFLAGCGSYDDNTPKGTGGTSGTAPTGGTSGTAPTGGASGSTPTGGTGPTGGTAGSGGSGPTGGMSGSGGTGAGGSGGGGAQPSCSEVPACGGDLVGAWTAASCPQTVTGMADLTLLGIGCTMVPVTGSLSVSGTWTGMAGGMYTDNTTTSGQAVLELPAICLEVSGFMAECDRLVFDPIGLNSVVCVDNAATMGCTCTATINQMGGIGSISLDASTSGTYTTADNKVVMTALEVNTEYSYCVAGNTLTMNLTTPSKIGTIGGPIVLTKP
ncbi:MAG TPA: hypothetical protein VFZ53_28725 [Polyangiaceae bacterium]